MNYAASSAAAEEVAQQIKELGGDALVIKADCGKVRHGGVAGQGRGWGRALVRLGPQGCAGNAAIAGVPPGRGGPSAAFAEAGWELFFPRERRVGALPTSSPW